MIASFSRNLWSLLDELLGSYVANPADVGAMAHVGAHVDDVWTIEMCLKYVWDTSALFVDAQGKNYATCRKHIKTAISKVMQIDGSGYMFEWLQ